MTTVMANIDSQEEGEDLAATMSAGIQRTATVSTIDDFRSAFADALATNDLTTLVVKVEAVGPAGYVTDLSLLENRYQFQRYLRERSNSAN